MKHVIFPATVNYEVELEEFYEELFSQCLCKIFGDPGSLKYRTLLDETVADVSVT